MDSGYSQFSEQQLALSFVELRMKFIHAADIHLDTPLQGLVHYAGAPVNEIRNATRRAFEKLLDAAARRHPRPKLRHAGNHRRSSSKLSRTGSECVQYRSPAHESLRDL